MLDKKISGNTALEELKKFDFIKHITHDLIVRRASTIASIEEDAAVLEFNKKKVLVATAMLVEGIHFNLVYTPLKYLGYKTVIINLSDIYAMNSQPTHIMVSIACSNKCSFKQIEEFYSGIKLACKKYQVDLVGVDISSSKLGFLISSTAIGLSDQQDIVLRKGARPNDLLVVSGDLGAAYMGLQILEREHAVFKINPDMQPEFYGYEYLIERQLKPETRKEVFDVLKSWNIKPTSMIDISDGLASDIIHICDQSQVGCKIFEDKLPIDPQTLFACDEFKINPSLSALNGGEDYELLFTVRSQDHINIKNHPFFTLIGYMTPIEEGIYMMTKEGHAIPITSPGWNNFSQKTS